MPVSICENSPSPLPKPISYSCVGK